MRGQAGSRLPLTAEDGRPQISGDYGCSERPGGTSAAAFLPDAPGAYWRTIAVTICPGKSGHK